MVNTNERVSLNKLQHLQTQFEDVKIGAKVIEKSEMFELDTLLVSAQDDYKGRAQMVNLAYVNDLADEETNLALLQYFTELDPTFDTAKLGTMESLLNFINVRMPMGHFCTLEDKVYYRYVLADYKESPDHAMKVIETFFTYVDVLDIFQEPIEQVMDGSLTLEDFKARF